MNENTNSMVAVSMMLLFSTMGFTALLIDFMTAQSPYGIFHFGGAGITDGLIWAPILSTSTTLLYLVVKRVLKLDNTVQF